MPSGGDFLHLILTYGEAMGKPRPRRKLSRKEKASKKAKRKASKKARRR